MHRWTRENVEPLDMMMERLIRHVVLPDTACLKLSDKLWKSASLPLSLAVSGKAAKGTPVDLTRR
jgi:hypothetical protein